jgi:hypothetical protein
MCEALGAEPVESEIPVEMMDFPDEVQETIRLYNKLRDDWDYMNGNYIGKSLIGFKEILDIWEVPDYNRKYVLSWMTVLDNIRSKTYANAKSIPKEAVSND